MTSLRQWDLPALRPAPASGSVGRRARRAVLAVALALCTAVTVVGTQPAVAERQATRVVSTDATYTVEAGGTAPPLNRFVRIENVGPGLVEPRLVVNGKDWSTADAIIREAVAAEMTDAEKARALFEFVRRGFFSHWTASEWTTEARDPVKLLNAYGYGLCGDVAASLAALFERAGLRARIWNPGSPPSHVVAEAFYDGGWHMFDADRPALYLARDNRTIAGVEDLIADPGLVQRAGPGHADLVGIYASTERTAVWAARGYYSLGHQMAIRLRPREALTLSWSDARLVHNDTGASRPIPFMASNGSLVSVMDASEPDWRRWLEGLVNVGRDRIDGRAQLTPTAGAGRGEFLYRVQSPYPIVAVSLRLEGARVGLGTEIDVYAARHVDAIEISGPELSRDDYRPEGTFVSEEHVTTFRADGLLPLVRPRAFGEPASLVYRVRPRQVPGETLRFGGRFYRKGRQDRLAIAVSTDGVDWRRVWEPADDQVEYFDQLVEVDRLRGAAEVLVRFEMQAGSNPNGSWTVGLGALRFLGVQPLREELVWTTRGRHQWGAVTADIDLSAAVASNALPAAYGYAVRVVMERGPGAAQVGVAWLSLDTTLQMSKHSLPALSLGRNMVSLSTARGAPGHVRVTHAWGERHGPRAPSPPSAAVFPPPNGVLPATAGPLRFEWTPSVDPQGAPIFQYHAMLCERPDCEWALSPSLDTQLRKMAPGPDGLWNTADDAWLPNSEPVWVISLADVLRPGTTYYWRVRAQDNDGDFSDWSQVWAFTWAAPPPAPGDAPGVRRSGEVTADAGRP